MALAFASVSFAGQAGTGSDVAAAAKPVITASYDGPVNCTAVGKTKYSPGLTDVIASRAVRITARLTCSSGPTGTAGVTVKGGRLRVTGTHTGDCANSTGPLTGSIKWNAVGGKVNPTQITWPGLARTFGPPIVDQIDSPPVGDRSITSGSYSGGGWNEGIEARLVDTGATKATCAEKRGIKRLSFSGVVSIKGTFSALLCSDAQLSCITDLELTPGRGWLAAANLAVIDLATRPIPTGSVGFFSPDCPSLFPATVPLTTRSSPGFVIPRFGAYDNGPLTDWGPLEASCDLRFTYDGDPQTLRGSYSF